MRKKNIFSMGGFTCGLIIMAAAVHSCTAGKQIHKQAERILLNDTAIRTGHIGICIYEPATNKYWYNYNATRYFIPASNTKLFTLYAGMKYLGDSLVGLRYEIENDTSLRIQPSGDPTFLNADFTMQPVYHFLSGYKKILITNLYAQPNPLGRGWAWDDYKESYMTQRSNLPLYANLIRIKKTGYLFSVIPQTIKYLIAEHADLGKGFDATKNWGNNDIEITGGTHQSLSIPFTPNATDVIKMLTDTLHLNFIPDLDFKGVLKNKIHSQPTDSLFKPMMYRSDNFFAEQTLLMASNEHLGYMNDEAIIDTLLKSDLKEVPQRPKWVDGSGLSRYNLFTPQSFVYILNTLKKEFGWDRIRNILPTGGMGTLSSYFKKDSSFIYAKTGTLSNNCALSGYLVTKKGKCLIFSVLVNNYMSGPTPIRKAVEQFLVGVREKY